jgi:hypothetical protein
MGRLLSPQGMPGSAGVVPWFRPPPSFAPAPLPLQNALQSVAAGPGTKPLQGRSPTPVELLIAARAGAGARKKIDRDDPRGGDGSAFLRLSFLPALPVAATLRLPLLLAVRGLAVAAPRLPLPPPVRLLAARRTAIPCHRLLGPEDSPAAFQQTDPAPRTTSPPPTPQTSEHASGSLIFGTNRRIFIRAHGSGRSQKLKPRRGHVFPFGAPSMHRESLNLPTLTQNPAQMK